MSHRIIILLLATLFLTGLKSNAQLVTNTSMTPTQLVEDILVGNGVAVSNVAYTGDPDAIGSFDGTACNIGLNNGIILTTGTVLGNSDGPLGPNNNGSAGVDNNQAGYDMLSDIVNQDTYNAAILEFDFIPQSDTIRFKYVFASEEYLEYVGEGVNDVFAFFISGPGFSGVTNMAQIPGGGGVVSIDNVNNASNSSYYIDNGDGSSSPQNSNNYYVQYDGFTIPIEAVAKVQCGETYHLKIAIADAGDGVWDSGIFLEANSLTSVSPITVSASTTFDLPNNQVAEGCETVTVTVNRDPSNSDDALNIPIIVSGTATQGADYTNIPNSITFNPGQTTLTFTFDILSDNITEGNETLIIKFNQPDPCGNANYIPLDFIIMDILPLNIVIPDVDVYCTGDEATLIPQVTGGIGIYTYLWDNGETTETITVSPANTTTYSVDVTDACLATTESGSGTVNVPVYPPPTIVTIPDTTVLCPNTPVQLFAEAQNGEGMFTYIWEENGNTIGNSPVINVSPMTTTTYTVTATDGCGATISDDVVFTVTTPVLTFTMSPDQLICPGDTTTIWAEAQGGLGDFTYYWYSTGETTNEITVSPQSTTTYTVAIEDGCHTYYLDGETTVNVIRPFASFNVLTSEPMQGLPVSFQNNSDGSVAWIWDFNNGETSTQHSPNTTYNEWGWQEVELVAINEIGCTDTLRRMVYIKPEFYVYIPNTFTPDQNRFNNTFKVSSIGATEMEFYIFNRWGDLIYYTTDIYFEWDGTYKGKIIADNTLVYKAKITDKEGIPHEYYGTINVLK
ncbi:MAG TPA: T9SS type B sorting domain-containing protein [Crocinitomix sp.]|nr:T9SS type B sorting domain-containing protein [Crocinitomix sp.]